MINDIKEYHLSELEKLTNEMTELKKEVEIKGKKYFRIEDPIKRNSRTNRHNRR